MKHPHQGNGDFHFDSNTHIVKVISIIMLCSLLLYLVFMPAINMLYYSADDFRYASGSFHKLCRYDDGFEFMITLGRPLQAYMDCLSYKFAYTLERMRIIRIVAVMLMGFGMSLFALWLYRLQFSLLEAIFVSGSMFLLKSLTADTISMGAISLPSSLLLCLIAYWVLQRYALQIRPRIYYLISAICLFAAMLTYPAVSFFFPVLILSKLLFSRFDQWNDIKKDAIREIVLFMFIGACYFVIAKHIMHHHPLAPVPDSYRVDHPNLNLSDLTHRILMVINLWNERWILFASSNEGVQLDSLLPLFMLGIVVALIRFVKNDAMREKKWGLIILAQLCVCTVAAFLLANAFFLIIPNLNLVDLRILYGVVAARLLIFVWCIYQIGYLFPSWVRFRVIAYAAILIYAATEANTSTTIIALKFSEYYRYVESSIAAYTKNSPLDRIHFIRSHEDEPYNGFFIANAALMRLKNTQDISVTWCSLPRGIPGAEFKHQNEMLACLNLLPRGAIAVTYSYDNEPYKVTKNMLVINVSDLKSYYMNHYNTLF